MTDPPEVQEAQPVQPVRDAHTESAVLSETQQRIAQNIEQLSAAARPGAVFGQPVVAGGYTVITASEVAAGGGFGFGGGTQPAARTGASTQTEAARGSGGGGGGGSSGRPVAVISIGPDGVKVQPVVDVAKIALAALSAWGAIALAVGRMAKQGRARRS